MSSPDKPFVSDPRSTTSILPDFHANIKEDLEKLVDSYLQFEDLRNKIMKDVMDDMKRVSNNE